MCLCEEDNVEKMRKDEEEDERNKRVEIGKKKQ